MWLVRPVIEDSISSEYTATKSTSVNEPSFIDLDLEDYNRPSGRTLKSNLIRSREGTNPIGLSGGGESYSGKSEQVEQAYQ